MPKGQKKSIGKSKICSKQCRKDLLQPTKETDQVGFVKQKLYVKQELPEYTEKQTIQNRKRKY